MKRMSITVSRLLGALVLLCVCSSSVLARDYLLGPVSADDFQAEPPSLEARQNRVQQTQEQAEIATGIYFEAQVATQYQADAQQAVVSAEVAEIELRTQMNPQKSWIDPQSRLSAALLQHEQGHFDISEIHRQQAAAHFAELQASGQLHLQQNLPAATDETTLRQTMQKMGEQLQQNLNRALQQIRQQESQMQARYDRETRHGIHTQQQAWWWQSLQQQLKAGQGSK